MGYRFCLNVCVAWSEHSMGKDEQLDTDFYSQMSDLAQILCFLDTSAVPLSEEIEQNIKVLQSDALFPHWVDSQIPNGEAALEFCVAVGQKWGLEETSAFQKAVAALENITKSCSNAAEESATAEEVAADKKLAAALATAEGNAELKALFATLDKDS